MSYLVLSCSSFATFLPGCCVQVLRIARLTEMVGLDMMMHNDQPDRNDYDIEMEKTRGGALSFSNLEPKGFVPVDLSIAIFPKERHFP